MMPLTAILTKSRRYGVPAALLAAGVSTAFAEPVLTPVPLQDVKVEGGFWGPKMNLWQRKTLIDVFDKFESHGGFANFDRVAAKQSGGHRGEPWWDGLIYETLTASADFLASHPDAELQKRVEGYVARIEAAAAADSDGYVNTGATLDRIGVRWSNPPQPGDEHDDNFPHTIYNAGCLVEAAVHLNRATGDVKLLRVATRMANYMCGIMGPPPKQNIIPGHAVSEMAFVRLYELYRSNPGLKEKVGLPVNEGEYLKLAEFWIENRGHIDGRKSAGAYNQDDMSVFRQPVLEGHAVRACLLATGVATAAAANGREDYVATGARWWKNMAEAKMYLTGGLGSIPGTEGFGADYDLPNGGYMETCASVAGGFFSAEMNRITGDAHYMDVLERELYNGALAGVSLTGDTYFYTNFLSAGPDHRRWSWMGGAINGTPCCPPMFLKLQSAFPGLMYATGKSGLYVNLYASGSARMSIDGHEVRLVQKTGYPWEGTIELALEPVQPQSFALNLRLPDWAKSSTVKVNGELQVAEVVNHYLRLSREWKAGDKITVDFPMPIERVKADPRTLANTGRVALMRGPVVYCAEGIDNGGRLSNVQLPPSASLSAEVRPDLLGGVTVLRGSALRAMEENGQVRREEAPFVAIPFFVNSNREPTDMEVWIADDAAQARPLTFAGRAEPSASHCFGNDTVRALNDGLEPKKSDDETLPRMTWWDHRGSREWAQLTFAGPQKLSGADLYWWDESRIGRDCRVPASWSLQYLDGEEWKPVQGASAYATEMDRYNRVDFQPVTTKALRVEVQLQPKWSAGILEWKVRGSSPEKP